MQSRINIQLILIDQMLAADLSISLVQMGYSISGWSKTFNNADQYDGAGLFIMDHQVESTVEQIKLPILFLSDNENEVFSGKQEVTAIQQLSPPFTKARLKPLIEKLLSSKTIDHTESLDSKTPLKLQDRIFVRHKEKMVKLEIKHIHYVEADSNYSRIFTENKEYIVAITLKTMESRLPESTFFRIHRSYIVNLLQIDEVAETHLVIDRKALPISKSIRPGLMKRLQTI